MQLYKSLKNYCLAGCLAGSLLLIPCATFAQSKSNSATPARLTVAAQHDGQHDFDFELGTWKIHLKRRLHPLTGSNTWVEFDGTSATSKLWDGRAQIEEFETNAAGDYIEGLTLRTYNPQTREWSLYWANSKDGKVVVPQIGQFEGSTGEFYAQDTLNGKSIFVRFIWSKTDTSVPHFEQSFSEDGGKTWEVNWITDQTHVPEDEFEKARAATLAAKPAK